MKSNGKDKPVLTFDFDGVLSDSLLEAYLLTWNLAGKVDPELAYQLADAPTINTIHAFRDSHRDHYEATENIIPYGNRCEDFLVAQKAVHLGAAINSQAEFDSFKLTVDKPLQDTFHEQFYVLRYKLAASHRQQWLDLNGAYPGVREAIPALAKTFRLSVATSKDRETVVSMLQSWGLFELFGEEQVLDKSSGPSKRTHLSILRERFGCRFEEMIFIDDKVSHLLDCADLGVRPVMSGWGYNGLAERAQAAEHGIQILALEELASLQM
jgi:phosphoglycolate phosphatase-like HAD superfamily hydrolase